MSIFNDMHSYRWFHSWHEFDEANRMLREAIERGYVESVTPLKHPTQGLGHESWYRDKETSETYRLASPNPPARGAWEPVDLEDCIDPNFLSSITPCQHPTNDMIAEIIAVGSEMSTHRPLTPETSHSYPDN
ncbi:MAG TPA: hypothetical protein VN734_10060 [Acidobacteriaceae bacterium]|nr:hypothetical protein [Acidobacteriaceae bacterium]